MSLSHEVYRDHGYQCLEYYRHDEPHRIDGPAIVALAIALDYQFGPILSPNWKLEYRQYGQKHRLNAPAIILEDTEPRYYNRGHFIQNRV
jgi:hypothetical protein